jgi:hypothetical protein
MSTKNVLARTRAAVARRNAARRDQRRLEREIASFRTPAERRELEEVLGRHRPDETRQIEAILRRRDAADCFDSSATTRSW